MSERICILLNIVKEILRALGHRLRYDEFRQKKHLVNIELSINHHAQCLT